MGQLYGKVLDWAVNRVGQLFGKVLDWNVNGVVRCTVRC